MVPTPQDCLRVDVPDKSIEQAEEEKLIEGILVLVANQLPWKFRRFFRAGLEYLEFETGLDLYYLWQELDKEARARVLIVLCGAVRKAGWLKAEIKPGRMGPETTPNLVIRVYLL